MKNPAPYIREQLVNLLDNAITYDGAQVPCYEGQGEVTKYQILIREQSMNERDDRHSFNDEFSQLIEVVSEQATSLHKHVDAIGSQVMDLMKPDTFTKGIADSADFQLLHVKRTSQGYMDEQSGEGTYINRLILRYNFLIVQK
jgi:hypothetical protein